MPHTLTPVRAIGCGSAINLNTPTTPTTPTTWYSDDQMQTVFDDLGQLAGISLEYAGTRVEQTDTRYLIQTSNGKILYDIKSDDQGQLEPRLIINKLDQNKQPVWALIIDLKYPINPSEKETSQPVTTNAIVISIGDKPFQSVLLTPDRRQTLGDALNTITHTKASGKAPQAFNLALLDAQTAATAITK